MSAVAAASRTGSALREVATEARQSWGGRATAAIGIVAVAALAPFVLGGLIATDTLASGAYLALAATGLAFAVGLAGVPSVAQGAFVGTGAIAAAHVLRHTALPGEVCALAGAVAAALLGTAAGFAVRSLDSVRAAVSTWLLSWLVALALGALPWLAGGAQGLVVPSRDVFGFAPTPTVHYELGVVLTGICALAFVALRGAPFGIDLAAARQSRGAAAALGVPIERLRVGAFAISAFVGGLAGGFAVQLDLVADPSAYGPLLSFELLVAVLVGGALAALGPSAGVIVLGLISLVAQGLGSLAAISGSRFQPMFEAFLVLAVLATGGSALIPAVQSYLWRGSKRRSRHAAAAWQPQPRRAALSAGGLTKRFGAVTAAQDVALELRPGTVTALIGPNGSGKTTVLRLLAGALAPDSGEIRIGAVDVTREATPQRVRAGLVRTLQSRAVFAELTARESVLVGVDRTRRNGGALRAVTSTPLFRSESAQANAAAAAALGAVGLAGAADRRVSELTTSERQRLMIAAALGANPAILLLDEPSAGAGDADLRMLAEILGRLKAAGLAILLVEHNRRLVAAAADELLELEDGRIARRSTL